MEIRFWRRAPVLLLPLWLAACGTAPGLSPDFERHRLSQVTQPRAGAPDVFFFDVRYASEYPAEGAAAEAVRREWLRAWVKQRALCPGGHEVVRVREFDFLEDNPARYDRRYEVRCTSPGATP
jgi:hypothetical protein